MPTSMAAQGNPGTERQSAYGAETSRQKSNRTHLPQMVLGVNRGSSRNAVAVREDSRQYGNVVGLEYVDSTHVSFRDGTYRWLDAAHFEIRGDSREPLAALEALLRHDQYVDHYMTADDVACTPEKAAEIARQRAAFKARAIADLHLSQAVPDNQPPASIPQLHGPYYAEFVRPESFDQLDTVTALRTLKTWLREAGGDRDRPVPPVDQMDGDLAALLAIFDSFAAAYRLRDLPDTALHEWGFVVHPYLELIGMDANHSGLWLIAGGTD